MKVNIYETVEVSDKDRIRIASVLDGKASKRQATRDELKTYIWLEGKEWDLALADHYTELSNDEKVNDEGDVVETSDEDMEDLI